MDNSRPAAVNRFVVASTVMLSFVSFWRAAAIVLSDLGSSAYYVGGIAEAAVGKAAPWFILAIMLFSYAVRAVYIESCSMFVRGGVYKVVHEAMGRPLAKFSVSALMFDYVLTGPISAVSAGLYLAALLNEAAVYFHHGKMPIPPPLFAAGFAVIVTLYFWLKNVMGLRESSGKALRIMQITTVMVVLLIGWCLLTVIRRGANPIPLPLAQNLHFSSEALGWLKGTAAPGITAIAIMIGLGHSLLAMSGEESLAQVNRELSYPKLQNLKRTGFAIFLYSLIFTSLVSFFAVMIIPDGERSKYFDNLIGGLSMFLVGPESLRLLFHAFVVLVGTLILAGAVNTALIGSNGVLNRVAEDGVLPDWFRQPNQRYGTTHRIISMVAILQLATIVISHGNVYILGEAYAFGVVWSFAMKSLAVLVLRYKRPEPRAWKVPLNFQVGKVEIPVGLALITLSLFAMALINVLTKKVATISGASFTVVFFVAFSLSEWYRRRKGLKPAGELERFNLAIADRLSPAAVQVRPGNVLIAMRDPTHMCYLTKVLDDIDPRAVDVVVLTVNPSHALEHDQEPTAEQIFGQWEVQVFSEMVHIAEKAGKSVQLIVASSEDPLTAILYVAHKLRSSRVVLGPSKDQSPAQQSYELLLSWEALPSPRPALPFTLLQPEPDEAVEFQLGPGGGDISPADEELAHRLGQKLRHGPDAVLLRHRDVVGIALRLFEERLRGTEAEKVLAEVRQEAALRR